MHKFITSAQSMVVILMENTGVIELQAELTGFFGLFVCFVFLGLHPVVNGSSQARGQIGAGAAPACLHHSHSKAKSKLHLQSTPQLIAMPDP